MSLSTFANELKNLSADKLADLLKEKSSAKDCDDASAVVTDISTAPAENVSVACATPDLSHVDGQKQVKVASADKISV